MTREPILLDMTVEGGFVPPPGNATPPPGSRMVVWAVLIATFALAGVIALFTLWLLAILIPIAILAALVAYLALRFQLWRNRGSIQRGTIHWVRRG